MRYYFDTEFIESSAGLELISIGIVCENENQFYAESTQFRITNAHDGWLKKNVLPKLKFTGGKTFKTRANTNPPLVQVYGTDKEIASAILGFVGKDPSPEFYAYYASYDWVIFARLFGRLIDKPKAFPMWCVDLKQMMWEAGLDKEWKQKTLPDPDGAHNAIVDALWNKDLHACILDAKARK